MGPFVGSAKKQRFYDRAISSTANVDFDYGQADKLSDFLHASSRSLLSSTCLLSSLPPHPNGLESEGKGGEELKVLGCTPRDLELLISRIGCAKSLLK